MCRNQVFIIFANNLRSKQNKKNPTHHFVYIGKYETCAKFQQKILNCRVVGTRQSFQILRQKTWFLETSRALSKLLYGILHYLISIIKLKQNHSIKKLFYIYDASHFKTTHPISLTFFSNFLRFSCFHLFCVLYFV